MPVSRSKSDLTKHTLANLKTICHDLKISSKGKKSVLIHRILEKENDSSKECEETTQDTDNDLSNVLVHMLKRQEEDRKQEREEDRKRQEEDRKSQEEERKLFMQVIQGIANTNQSNNTGIEQATSSSKHIMKKIEWMFEDLDTKMNYLDEEMNGKLGEFTYKESIKLMQSAVETLSKTISENIHYFNEDISACLQKRFRKVNSQIQEKKCAAINLCKQDTCAPSGNKQQSGCLPSGITPPTFFGEVDKFPVWWESFDAVVHSNQQISVFYKYLYLRQSMKGSAAMCLDSFSPLVEHYPAALDYVKERYGQPRKIVRHVMKSIIEIPQMSSNDSQNLRRTLDLMHGSIHTLTSYLENLSKPVDAILIPILEAKLTNELRESWERELLRHEDKEFVSIKDYLQWFNKEVKSKETSDPIIETNKTKERKTEIQKTKNFAYSTQSLMVNREFEERDGCKRCWRTNHRLQDCYTFLKDPVPERWNFARNLNLCFQCLEEFHPRISCKSNNACSIDGCTRNHHKLLHFKNAGGQPNETTHSLNSNVKVSKSNNTESIMPSAVAYLRSENGVAYPVRVAFDTMCQDSFIREHVVRKLGIPYEKNLTMHVNGFGEHVSTMNTGRVSFGLSKYANDETVHYVNALVRPGRICAPLDEVTINWNRCTHLKGLDIADTLPHSDSEIDVLIGINHYLKLVSGSLIKHPTDNEVPAAMETVFGYVLMGMNERSSLLEQDCSKREKIGCMFIQTRPKTELELTVEKFWNLESAGITDNTPTLTKSDREAVSHFNNSIRFDEDRYCVGLPFDKDAPVVKSNFEKAKRIMYSTERRLQGNTDLKDNYEKAMQDYEKLGFARKATAKEIEDFKNGPEYFVPHHAVVRQDSVTTKTRIVFNASSPNEDGVSLNDCLLSGPALQPDLVSILLRFRTHKVGVMGDIEKMFCQTKIDPKDYKYQQYLWRHFDKDSEPIRYIMVRLMFGIKSSPFLAIGSLNYHANRKDMIEKYPLGCQASSDMYVDDYCGGSDSSENAIELVGQLRKLFQDGGWNMTKFISNSSEVMNAVPETDRLTKKIVEFDRNNDGITKALGIGWDVSDDEFCFKPNEKLYIPLERLTKRTVLSKVSQVYDVFGFCAAFTIRAKIMIQTFWELLITWDELLSGDIAAKFRQWEKELTQLKDIRIPRLILKGTDYLSIDLISFADASEKAYGCMVYARITYADGHIDVKYIMGKSRVHPLKVKSLARLELLALVLATQLTQFIIESLNHWKFDSISFFTDSMIALSWIKKSSTTWKTFVANRVQDIHDRFDPKQFHHVPSHDNPADMISRGVSMEELKESQLHWYGPRWLSGCKSEWPDCNQNFDNTQECIDERKTSHVLVTRLKDDDIITRYEKYSRLVRIVAQMLKWKNSDLRTRDGNLSTESYRAAEYSLIRNVQKQRYPTEFDDLENGKLVSCNSNILCLDPKFDFEKRILVVGGRLNNSELPEESKHQIILPEKEILTEKIILHYHTIFSHAAIETTLCIIRQRFWIIHGRREVSKAIHKCLKCRHLKTSPCEQKMGSLPSQRVCVAPAFTNIGLDFSGPLLIKADNEIVKAYVCIFSCMQSRMVHLELTLTMKTDAFLDAFRRMINRRGLCKYVISDNFSSFKKAKKLISSNQLREFCGDRNIKWQFNTERSPFRVGFYERLNQSLKKSLKIVLGRALLTYIEMSTVLTDIECSVNQRPLTYQGPDPGDSQAITPAHLALGRPLSAFSDFSMDNVSIPARYKHMQVLQDHFWKRWTREFLSKLQIRQKWKKERPPLNINDICLITDEKVKRNQWPLARVTELIRGKDGLVRTVKLQNEKGVYVRPVQKLHLYERFIPTDEDISNFGE